MKYQKGRKETINEKEIRIKGLINSWKNRKDYIGEIKNHKIYNCWRGFRFTIKGKKIGFDDRWKDYKIFYNDVFPNYKDGLIFSRIDKTLPFSNENFIWLEREITNDIRNNSVLLEYNNEIKTLKEWAKELELSLSGIRSRYYKDKNLPSDEILFGRKKGNQKKLLNSLELYKKEIRSKASRMCSSYKIKDKKRRFYFDIDTDWIIDNILFENCTYCGIDKFIGCDRIDNNKGHSKDNVVPCCFTCNTARNNNFSFEEMKILGKEIGRIIENRKCVIKINK